MDYIALPPEVTSALIHSGPGAWSLIEASEVWEHLSIELEDSVRGYSSAMSSVADWWQGPSSAAMAQAVQPYLAWLWFTAQQCRQVGASAQAAAAAYDSARSAVVHPVSVAANRVRLVQLLATNWFGNNSAAIAATEDEYEGMWANNSAAMDRYQASSAQASTLPSFSSPPQIAEPTSVAAQTTSAAQTTVTPAGAASTSAQSGLAQALTSAQSQLGDLLTSILSYPGGFNPQAGWFGLANAYGDQFVSSGFPINLLSYLAQLSAAQSLTDTAATAAGESEGEAALGAAAGDIAGAAHAVGAEATAAVGVGVPMGALKMPPSVVGVMAGSQVPVRLAAAVSPLPADDLSLSDAMPPMMPRPPGMPASGSSARKGRDYEDIEYGLELKGLVMQRPPSAG